MSDTVIVFVADEKYLPHYKALAVNCRMEGEYTGDFLFIVPDTGGPWVQDLVDRGFHILEVPDKGFLAKFNIFHPYLRKWKQAFYIDADVIIQLPLQPLFDQLTAWPRENDSAKFGEYHRKKLISSREEVPTFMGWQVWDKEWESHTEIYESMRGRFPHMFTADKMWSTALLIWEPASIPDGTVQALRGLQEEFFVCNDPSKGGTDEQIIDLHLHNQMAQVSEKGWCFWGLDEDDSRVKSIARGWRGDEIPIAIHYGRWYAPWVVKTPDMDAYDAPRLGKVCHEFYAENLAAFENEFPITGAKDHVEST